MTQSVLTDYAQTFISDDLTLETLFSLQGRVFSSPDERAAFGAFATTLESASTEKEKIALAVCRWIEGRCDDSVAILDGIKSTPVVDFIKAHCLLAHSDPGSATALLLNLAERAECSAVHALLSKCHRRVGDYAAAAAVVAAARKRFPACAMLFTEAGILADLDGDYMAARECYEQALECDRDCAEALFRLAFNSDLHGDSESALGLYQRCVRIQPVRSRALVNLGLLYEELGYEDEAVECYRLVVRRYPQNHRARLYLRDAVASEDMYFDEELAKRHERRNKILETPITDFELSVRSRNCLEKMDVTTLGDLTRISEPELLSFKNFGETSLGEIKDMLGTRALHLGQALEEQPVITAPAPVKKKVDDKPAMLSKPVEDLGLSVRSQHCMQTLGIELIGDLAAMSEKELLASKNFGSTSLSEVRKKLAAHGLGLAEKD